MHVVVLGAGAVGGYFGAKLAQAGTEVTFLVRERRFQQLKQHGLQVHSTYGDFSIEPKLATDAAQVEKPDVVIVGVKNYHLNAALPQLRTFVQQGAKILPLLNGVEHMDTLVKEFGQDSVLGGSCYIEATLDAEGRVMHTSPMHDIVFGSIGSVSANWLAELEQEFAKSGINVKLSSHILQDMWKKFIFLVSFSGITTATRAPIGVTINDSVSYTFLQSLIREILMVAELQNVGLPTEEVFQQILKLYEKTSPAMTSSLHRDLEKGLPLEVESLQGSVLRMAEAGGKKPPAMQAVYALMHPFISGNPNND